jgi:phage baseplate assembly protein V
MLRNYLVEEPSPNQAERFYGVVLGVVEQNNEIADAQIPIGRVKVSFPGLSDSFTSGWAPCASPMAGDDMGFFALPEPGAQVLVAFEHGDLAKPYVLGSLYHAKNPPPATNLDGTNSKRIIKSRAGHTITFDDTLNTGAISIEDMAGSSVTLNSVDRSVEISAQGNLKITGKGDITIDSNGTTITVKGADGSVDLRARGDVSINSTQKLTIDAGGNTITADAIAGSLSLEATTDLSIKSNGKLDLNATGPITLSAPAVNVS